MVLIFSRRDETRSMLTAGLLQNNLRIIEASNSYIAGIKANQYLPDLIIADITKNNIKDFLFLSRLERSSRTKEISVIISVSSEVRTAIDKINKEAGLVPDKKSTERVHIVEYPYNFNYLSKKIKRILASKAQQSLQEESSEEKTHRILGKRLLELTIPAQNKLQLIESTVDKQWAFPFTMVRSLEIMGSKKSCCNELARCIESDVAAASAVLSIVNKVAFAGRYGRITNVKNAVVRMGFNQTRNIMASLSLIDISPDIHLKFGFKRSEFWMHSLATAVIAEKLCQKTKIKRPELAFIAGLIHDIGKIPLDNNFTQIFSTLLENTTNNITSFYEVERELMQITHTDIGHFFTSKWGFPQSITLSILNHHQPERILKTKLFSDRLLQESVFVANIFAKAMRIGHSSDEILRAIPESMLKDLHISGGPTEQFNKFVINKVRQYYEYLKISVDDLAFREPQRGTQKIPIYIICNKKERYHPLILGLHSSGFSITFKSEIPSKIPHKSAIAIIIPELESTLNLTLTGDEGDPHKKEPSLLKIFLLDNAETKEPRKDFTKSNIVMINSHTVDLRFILQIIEDYYFATTM